MLYDLSIYLYVFVIKFVALFNPKARLWVDGRKNIFKRLKEAFEGNSSPVAWFHCASLGEFEQGRALMERFKELNPKYKLVLTFFSPSGYEIRKSYSGADYVFYLPADTRANAKKFVDITNPRVVFFIKYEFWKNYLGVVNKRGVPLYLVSAIFRNNQRFFKWYGVTARRILRLFTTIFVQDDYSADLLKGVKGLNVVVAGDTRFDRVYQTAMQTPRNELIEQFCEGSRVLICGSSWLPDEEIVCEIIKRGELGLKYIIVPHEVDGHHIETLQRMLCKPSTRYTQAKRDNMADILIVDTIGILSQIYRYTTYAYIGGGFGVGIHNILEAATFGKPIFFGPNYRKFREANELIALGGAVSINNADELDAELLLLKNDENEYDRRVKITKQFVENNIGATEKIIQNS